MRAVKGKAELAFSFPRIYLHLFYCVFIPEAQHNQESLFCWCLMSHLLLHCVASLHSHCWLSSLHTMLKSRSWQSPWLQQQEQEVNL